MTLIPWRRHSPAERATDDFFSPFEKFFERALVPRLPEAFRSGHLPPLNVSEDEESFAVSVELPGIEEKDIDVQLMGNQLIISGERKFEEEKKDKEFHRVESQYGSFSRSVTLPHQIRFGEAEATYSKGILTVRIPKAEPTPTSKIKVQVKD